MTVRRDPFSVEGAWTDTCNALGWGHVAYELGVSENLLREWSNPNSPKCLPMWAADRGDELLRERGNPEYNIKAAAARRGARDRSLIGQLREVERDFQMALRAMDLTADDEWPLAEATEQLSRILRRTAVAMDRIRLQQERLITDIAARKDLSSLKIVGRQ